MRITTTVSFTGVKVKIGIAKIGTQANTTKISPNVSAKYP